MNEVSAQKTASLQRCISRAREAHARAGAAFATEYDLQDAAILNIIRACEAAIDLANMTIRQRRLGIPSESRESFAVLAREGLIDAELGTRLQKMVGFRNLAVHQYRDIDLKIVESLIQKRLQDLLEFAAAVHPILQG